MFFKASILGILTCIVGFTVAQESCQGWYNQWEEGSGMFRAVLDVQASQMTRSMSNGNTTSIEFVVRTPVDGLIEDILYNFDDLCPGANSSSLLTLPMIYSGPGSNATCFRSETFQILDVTRCNLTLKDDPSGLFEILSGGFHVTGLNTSYFQTRPFQQSFSVPVWFQIKFPKSFTIDVVSIPEPYNTTRIYGPSSCASSADCNGYPCELINVPLNLSHCKCSLQHARGLHCEVDLAPARVVSCPSNMTITLDEISDTPATASLGYYNVPCIEVQFNETTGGAIPGENNFFFQNVTRRITSPTTINSTVQVDFFQANIGSDETYTGSDLCGNLTLFDEVGVWTVQYEVVDTSGTRNGFGGLGAENQCIFTVTVEDTFTPVANCTQVSGLVARGYTKPEDAVSETSMFFADDNNGHTMHVQTTSNNDETGGSYGQFFASFLSERHLGNAIRYYKQQICDDLKDNTDTSRCSALSLIDSQGDNVQYNEAQIASNAFYTDLTVSKYSRSDVAAPDGVLNLTFIYEDSSGNQGSCQVSFQVKNAAPTIECPGDSNVVTDVISYNSTGVSVNNFTHFSFRRARFFLAASDVQSSGLSFVTIPDTNATFSRGFRCPLCDANHSEGMFVSATVGNLGVISSEKGYYEMFDVETTIQNYTNPTFISRGGLTLSIQENRSEFLAMISESVLGGQGRLEIRYSCENGCQVPGDYMTGYQPTLMLQYGVFDSVGNLAVCRNDWHVYQNVNTNPPQLQGMLDPLYSTVVHTPNNSRNFEFSPVTEFYNRSLLWPTNTANPSHLYQNPYTGAPTGLFSEQIIQFVSVCVVQVAGVTPPGANFYLNGTNETQRRRRGLLQSSGVTLAQAIAISIEMNNTGSLRLRYGRYRDPRECPNGPIVPPYLTCAGTILAECLATIDLLQAQWELCMTEFPTSCLSIGNTLSFTPNTNTSTLLESVEVVRGDGCTYYNGSIAPLGGPCGPYVLSGGYAVYTASTTSYTAVTTLGYDSGIMTPTTLTKTTLTEASIYVLDVTPPVFGFCPGDLPTPTTYTLGLTESFIVLTYQKDIHYEDVVRNMSDTGLAATVELVHVLPNYIRNSGLIFYPNIIYGMSYEAYDKKGNKAECLYDMIVDDPHPPVFSGCDGGESDEVYIVLMETGENFGLVQFSLWTGAATEGLVPGESIWDATNPHIGNSSFDLKVVDYGSSNAVVLSGACVGADIQTTAQSCTITATDDSNNTASCVVRVAAVDIQAPVLTCGSISHPYGDSLTPVNWDFNLTDNSLENVTLSIYHKVSGSEFLDLEGNGLPTIVGVASTPNITQVTNPPTLTNNWPSHLRLASQWPYGIACGPTTVRLPGNAVFDNSSYCFSPYILEAVATDSSGNTATCQFQLEIVGFCGDGFMDLTGAFGPVEECEIGQHPERFGCNPSTCTCEPGYIQDASGGCYLDCSLQNATCETKSLIDTPTCQAGLRSLTSIPEGFFVDQQVSGFVSNLDSTYYQWFANPAAVYPSDSFLLGSEGTPHAISLAAIATTANASFDYRNWVQPLEPTAAEVARVLGFGQQEQLVFEWYTNATLETRVDCNVGSGSACAGHLLELIVCGDCVTENFTAAFVHNASGLLVRSEDQCGPGYEARWNETELCWYFPLCTTGAVVVGEPDVVPQGAITCLDNSTIVINNSQTSQSHALATWDLESRLGFAAGVTLADLSVSVDRGVLTGAGQPYESGNFSTIPSDFLGFVGTTQEYLNTFPSTSTVSVTAQVSNGATDAGCSWQVVVIDVVAPELQCPPNRNYVLSSADGALLSGSDPIGFFIQRIGLSPPTVYNVATGRTWLSYNLGAPIVFSSTAGGENPDAYGSLYQWGRLGDGHELRTSNTTTTRATSIKPPHGDFILSENSWYEGPISHLWGDQIDNINNPCPLGFTVPNRIEWLNEIGTWTSGGFVGAANSSLRLTWAGYRNNTSGNIEMPYAFGCYHTTSISLRNNPYLYIIQPGSPGFAETSLALGCSVRCINSLFTTESDFFGDGLLLTLKSPSYTDETFPLSPTYVSEVAVLQGQDQFGISSTATLSLTTPGQTVVAAFINQPLVVRFKAFDGQENIGFDADNPSNNFCDFTFTVQDTEPPIVTCTANVDLTDLGLDPGSFIQNSHPGRLPNDYIQISDNHDNRSSWLLEYNVTDSQGVLFSQTLGLINPVLENVNQRDGDFVIPNAQLVMLPGIPGDQTNVVVVTATDSVGNVGSCSISVALTDLEPPFFSACSDTSTIELAIDHDLESAVVNLQDYFTVGGDNLDLVSQLSVSYSGNYPLADVPIVENTATGRKWMDRNLGASNVATSASDASSYGGMFQWGRVGDGHEFRTSASRIEISSTAQPTHGDFIRRPNAGITDWLSTPNDNLWQGLLGENNPCPSGFKIPSATEWMEERASWNSVGSSGSFGSPLRLSLGGRRDFGNGGIIGTGSYAIYCTSSISGSRTQSFNIGTLNSTILIRDRGEGCSVRCIAEDTTWTSSQILVNIIASSFAVNVLLKDVHDNVGVCTLSFEVIPTRPPSLSCSAITSITTSQLASGGLYDNSVFQALTSDTSDAGVAGELKAFLEANCSGIPFSGNIGDFIPSGGGSLGLCPGYEGHFHQVSNHVVFYTLSINPDPPRLTTGPLPLATVDLIFTTTEPDGNVSTITCPVTFVDDHDPTTIPNSNGCGFVNTIIYVRDPNVGYMDGLLTLPGPDATAYEIYATNGVFIPTISDNVAVVKLFQTHRNFGIDPYSEPFQNFWNGTFASNVPFQQPVPVLNPLVDFYTFKPRLGATYLITYAEDTLGNSAFCRADLTLVDNEAPVIQGCPSTSIVIQLNDTFYCEPDGAGCNYTVTYNVTDWLGLGEGDAFTDATRGVLFINKTVGWITVEAGTYNHNQTYVDLQQNTATCNFDLIIEDNVPPSILFNNETGQRRRMAQISQGQINQLTKVETFRTTGGAQINISDMFPTIAAIDNGVLKAIFEDGISTLYRIKPPQNPQIRGAKEQLLIITCAVESRLTDPLQNYSSDNCFDVSRYFAGNHSFTYTATDGQGNIGLGLFQIDIIDTELQELVKARDSTVIIKGNGKGNSGNGNGNGGNGRRRFRNLLQLPSPFPPATTTDSTGIVGTLRFQTETLYPYELSGLARAPEYETERLSLITEAPIEQFSGSYLPMNCGSQSKEIGTRCIQHYLLEFNVANCTSLGVSEVTGLPTVLRMEFATRCVPQEGDPRFNGDECQVSPYGIPVTLAISASDYCGSFIDTVSILEKSLVTNKKDAQFITTSKGSWNFEELRDYKQNSFFFETGKGEICIIVHIHGEPIGEISQSDYSIRHVDVLSAEVRTNNKKKIQQHTTPPMKDIQWSSGGENQGENNIVIGCINTTWLLNTSNSVEIILQANLRIEYIIYNTQGAPLGDIFTTTALIDHTEDITITTGITTVTSTPLTTTPTPYNTAPSVSKSFDKNKFIILAAFSLFLTIVLLYVYCILVKSNITHTGHVELDKEGTSKMETNGTNNSKIELENIK